jgi:hypothetical protein
MALTIATGTSCILFAGLDESDLIEDEAWRPALRLATAAKLPKRNITANTTSHNRG